MTTPDIEMKRDPFAQVRYTSIPKELQEHFANQDQVVHLGNAMPEVVSTRSVLERFPILAEELPEEIRKHLLSQHGFRIESDGTLRRGDCLLYRQSIAARDYHREVAAIQWAAMDDPETVYEQMQDWNSGLAGRGAFMDPKQSEVHPAEDYARHGPALLDELRRVRGG